MLQQSVSRHQRRQRKRDSCGASPRRPRLCQTCTRSAILAQVAAPREGEQPNNIVNRSLPLSQSKAIPSAYPYAAPDSVLGHLRVLSTPSGWASVLQRDLCAGDPAFIYEAPAGGDPPAARPRARFNTFRWLHSYVGLTSCLNVEDRPKCTGPTPAQQGDRQ